MTKATIVSLTDSTKRLLSKMHFGEIPEEAKFIIFSEDGKAQYVMELRPDILTAPYPTHTVVTSWEDIEIEIEE